MSIHNILFYSIIKTMISKIHSKLCSNLNKPTSYQPLMTWLIKWITKSHATPVMWNNNSLTIIQGINFVSAIHYFTLIVTFLYPITFCFWFYVYIFLDKTWQSRPVWDTIFDMYYFMCYITLGSLHYLLHFRASELSLLFETTGWFEKVCIEKGTPRLCINFNLYRNFLCTTYIHLHLSVMFPNRVILAVIVLCATELCFLLIANASI